MLSRRSAVGTEHEDQSWLDVLSRDEDGFEAVIR